MCNFIRIVYRHEETYVHERNLMMDFYISQGQVACGSCLEPVGMVKDSWHDLRISLCHTQ